VATEQERSTTMTTQTHTYDYVIRDVEDNGEFLSWATVDYLEDGKVVQSERFCGTTEEPPGYTGLQLARSAAAAWLEVATYTVEERLGPYGLEWQREQEERRGRDLPF
jgi:hypothetical protein